MPRCYHSGGSGGIRTLGRACTRLHDYKSATLNRSVTDPPSHSSKDLFQNLEIDGGPRIGYNDTSSVLAIRCLDSDGQRVSRLLTVYVFPPICPEFLPKNKKPARNPGCENFPDFRELRTTFSLANCVIACATTGPYPSTPFLQRQIREENNLRKAGSQGICAFSPKISVGNAQSPFNYL